VLRSRPMPRFVLRFAVSAFLVLSVTLVQADTLGDRPASLPPLVRVALPDPATPGLAARIIAIGIPGAGAIAQVGAFHAGGPIHDNPTFAIETASGRVLDPTRILVASDRSNFGTPPGRPGDALGAVLSLDPQGADGAGPILVPARFAAAGDQATALGGRVRLFAAQSTAFRNGNATPGAATADLPSVAAPLGISINNAFGRLWFANAPQGTSGPGTLSIADPNGAPLANAPSRRAGGVFAGDLTPRSPRQAIAGQLQTAAVATAFIGPSPDGSRRAVFAVLTADGALAQAHTERDLDGLAPAATVSALPGYHADGQRPRRAGLVFNWVPDRTLFATDAERGAIVTIDLADDGEVFRVAGRRLIVIPELHDPVDLAPAVPESASPAFSANTTLAAGSDLYVANRGDGTVVRLRQDGRVIAARRVMVEGAPLGAGMLNGIAASADAKRLWLTVDGPLPNHAGAPGAVLEIPAFGPGTSAAIQQDAPQHRAAPGTDATRDARLFVTEFRPEHGLGPLFNARSCVECHRTPAPGGVGAEGLAIVYRVGFGNGGTGYAPLPPEAGGPVARLRSVAEFGMPCPEVAPPALGTTISARNATPLFGLGLINAIPDAEIEAVAAANAVFGGRPHRVREPGQGEGRRIGRFGWKADAVSLERFVAEALRNELGITGPLAPTDPGVLLAPTCGPRVAGDAAGNGLDDVDGTLTRSLTAYLTGLPAPAPGVPSAATGSAVFHRIGCAGCHEPQLRTDTGLSVALHSDLLLHDMGPLLDDGVTQGEARGRDWRTAPLWGLSMRARLLHDGRATTPTAAILTHDGQGAAAASAFRRLSEQDRDALLEYLARL
jgi:Di-haem oxidoreductase, putative peroxidase